MRGPITLKEGKMIDLDATLCFTNTVSSVSALKPKIGIDFVPCSFWPCYHKSSLSVFLHYLFLHLFCLYTYFSQLWGEFLFIYATAVN